VRAPEPEPAVEPEPEPYVEAAAPILRPPPSVDPPADAEIRVVVRLVGGEEVVAGTYTDQDAARARAQELVEAVQRRDAWTFVAGRPLEPEKIDSIYLA